MFVIFYAKRKLLKLNKLLIHFTKKQVFIMPEKICARFYLMENKIKKVTINVEK